MSRYPLLTANEQMRVLSSWYAMHDRGGTAKLTCIGCGTEVEQYFNNLYYMEDSQIAPFFLKKGWTIKPTCCPACAAKTKEGNEQ